MKRRAVKTYQQNEPFNKMAIVRYVSGGVVYVSERKGGATYRVQLGDTMNYDTLRPGDSVILMKADSNYIVVGKKSETRARSNATVGRKSPIPSRGASSTINGIPSVASLNIRGKNGISVSTNEENSEILVAMEGSASLPDKSFEGLEKLGFSSGASFIAAKYGVILANSDLYSDTRTIDTSWTLSPSGSWLFISQRPLVGGPEFTPRKFIWWGKSGASLFRLNDLGLSIGLPGHYDNILSNIEVGIQLRLREAEIRKLSGDAGLTIGTDIGFFDTAPQAQITITQSLSDLTTTGALNALLEALATYGLIVNNSTS